MLKYAITTAAVGWHEGLIRLNTGDAWYADDPFVKAHPGFFGDLPPNVRSTVPVEQATANPGEKRARK